KGSIRQFRRGGRGNTQREGRWMTILHKLTRGMMLASLGVCTGVAAGPDAPHVLDIRLAPEFSDNRVEHIDVMLKLADPSVQVDEDFLVAPTTMPDVGESYDRGTLKIRDEGGDLPFHIDGEGNISLRRDS